MTETGGTAEALALYRAALAELGPEGAAEEARRAGMPPRIRRILAAMASQPSGMAERRAAMVDAIGAALRNTGAALDEVELRRVLDALRSVPREAFLAPEAADFAYLPTSVAIGEGQVASHPLVVACIALAVAPRGGDVVLDVGTGCGYQAAVLARLARSVVAVEVRPDLARGAADRLAENGFRNVEVRVGDGALGASDRAPFDAIAVAAAGPRIPPRLPGQLRPGGRLIMPIGPHRGEHLVLAVRGCDGSLARSSLGPARFVPFVGPEGRDGDAPPEEVEALPLRFGASLTSAALRGDAEDAGDGG